MSKGLTQTQEWILDVAESDADLSNADIAERTGTHVAVVRDLIQRQEEMDEESGSAVAGPTTVVDRLTGTRAAVLQLAAANPALSNAELAERADTHTALVRDLRSNVQTASLEEVLRNPERSNAELAEITGTHTALVRDLRDDIRTTVLEYTLRNPELTNAEIAVELGTHTALVRDVRKAYEDGVEEVGITAEEDDEDAGSTVAGPTPVVDDFSETRVAVLQKAASDPDLTNAEIAAELDTHTALVRDLRTDMQAEILVHALRNPDATNADIAAEVDAHTALVRDARNSLETKILELSLRSPELSNADLAAELDVHIATVRDARAGYEAAIEDVDRTPSDGDSAEPTAVSDETTAASDETTAQPTATSDDGLSGGAIVAAVLVGLLVLIVAALAL